MHVQGTIYASHKSSRDRDVCAQLAHNMLHSHAAAGATSHLQMAEVQLQLGFILQSMWSSSYDHSPTLATACSSCAVNGTPKPEQACWRRDNQAAETTKQRSAW